MNDNRICSGCGKSIFKVSPFCPFCGKKQPRPMNEEEAKRDPFAILQVSEDAEDEVIDAAYRSLARKYHPDKGGGEQGQERMKDINWAYSVLQDQHKRQEWIERRKGESNQAQRPSSPGSHSSQKPPPTTSKSSTARPSASTRPSSPRGSTYQPISNSNSGGIKVWLVILVVVAILIIGSLSGNPSTSSRSSSNPSTGVRVNPTRTNKPVPTRTTRPVPTRTQTFSHRLTNSRSEVFNCVHWSQVKYSHVHETISDLECVYGIVKNTSMSGAGQYLLFSDQKGTFRIYGYEKWVTIPNNTCIAVIGAVYGDNPSFLYITLDWGNTEVYTYNGC